MEKVRQWKPRDFYLVYKMWTDEEYRNVNRNTGDIKCLILKKKQD